MVSKSNNTTTIVRFLSHQLSQYPAATAKVLLVSVAKLTGDVKKMYFGSKPEPKTWSLTALSVTDSLPRPSCDT